MTVINLVSTGTFEQNEILTRALQHTFHVQHEQDTDLCDNLVTRQMTIHLNGRNLDDGQMWLELVDVVKQRVAADYEYQIEHWRAQSENWQRLYNDLIADLAQLIDEMAK